jgi:hypothetical protein
MLGVTIVIITAIMAPVTAAVAQTLARARVSAPITCPDAYITAPSTVRSMAATGRREVMPEQMSLTAETTLLIPATAVTAATDARMKKSILVFFMDLRPQHPL